MPVKVLDCDTISQAKEKMLDQLYKGVSLTQRPDPRTLDVGKGVESPWGPEPVLGLGWPQTSSAGTAHHSGWGGCWEVGRSRLWNIFVGQPLIWGGVLLLVFGEVEVEYDCPVMEGLVSPWRRRWALLWEGYPPALHPVLPCPCRMAVWGGWTPHSF